MSFIKINDAESLNIDAIQAFMATERKVSTEILEPNGNETVRGLDRFGERETVLTITRKDGKHFVLFGAEADAALEILRYHGTDGDGNRSI